MAAFTPVSIGVLIKIFTTTNRISSITPKQATYFLGASTALSVVVYCILQKQNTHDIVRVRHVSRVPNTTHRVTERGHTVELTFDDNGLCESAFLKAKEPGNMTEKEFVLKPLIHWAALDKLSKDTTVPLKNDLDILRAIVVEQEGLYNNTPRFNPNARARDQRWR